MGSSHAVPLTVIFAQNCCLKREAKPQSWLVTLVLRVVQFMGDVLLSAKERLKVDMRNAAAQFERFEGDTGSTEVQGAPRCMRVQSCRMCWL